MMDKEAGLVAKVGEVYDISVSDVLRLYYCGKFNRDAVRKRRAGGGNEKLGDKYIVTPRVAKMDACLARVGFDEFFNENVVLSEGLTLGGFIAYSGGLVDAFGEYIKSENLLGSGWRN